MRSNCQPCFSSNLQNSLPEKDFILQFREFGLYPFSLPDSHLQKGIPRPLHTGSSKAPEMCPLALRILVLQALPPNIRLLLLRVQPPLPSCQPRLDWSSFR